MHVCAWRSTLQLCWRKQANPHLLTEKSRQPHIRSDTVLSPPCGVKCNTDMIKYMPARCGTQHDHTKES